MPIITIASTKGGVGKSTLAVNLATQLVKMGHPAALLDADPQGSTFKWSTVRDAFIEAGEQLSPIFAASVTGRTLLELSLEKSQQGYYVLIDSAGVDNQSTRHALVRSDYVLMISAPSTLDLWEINPLLKVIANLGQAQRRKVPVFLLFNKVSPQPSVKSVSDAHEFMAENLIFPTHTFKSVVKDRIVYQHGIREGKGVAEYTPVNRHARREIANITDELLALTSYNLRKEVA